MVFCPVNKGFILWSVTTSGIAPLLLMPEDDRTDKEADYLRSTLKDMREGSGMLGPNRELLQRFGGSWMRTVCKITEASINLQAAALDPVTHDYWKENPEAAFAWLHAEHKKWKKHQRRAAAPEQAGAF